MAEVTEIDWEVAAFISMVSLSEAVHTLPNPGGLLDQDSLFIHCYMYYNELREMRRQLDERKRQLQQQRVSGGHR